MLIAQFADDTQLFLDSEKSIKNAIKTLEDIETHIGLRVNYKKTNVITLGGAPRCLKDIPLVWDPGGMTVLGIDVLDNPENQYHQILNKARDIKFLEKTKYIPNGKNCCNQHISYILTCIYFTGTG